MGNSVKRESNLPAVRESLHGWRKLRFSPGKNLLFRGGVDILVVILEQLGFLFRHLFVLFGRDRAGGVGKQADVWGVGSYPSILPFEIEQHNYAPAVAGGSLRKATEPWYESSSIGTVPKRIPSDARDSEAAGQVSARRVTRRSGIRALAWNGWKTEGCCRPVTSIRRLALGE